MARRKFSVSICVFLLVPVVIPALFVLLISPIADQAGAEEMGPKQGYLSGDHSAEAPRSSTNRAASNQVAKPSGKMGFVPASPSSRESSTSSPRPVVNPVARRSVPQPPKYNVFAGTAPEPPKTQNSVDRSVVSRPTAPQTLRRPQPQTNSDVRITSRPVPVAPRAAVSPTELPENELPRAELSRTERPQAEPQQPDSQQPALDKLESPFKTIEPAVASSQQAPVQMLEEPDWEDRPVRSTVKLFFDDEPVNGEPDEDMELGVPVAPAAPADEIRHVAAQGEENQNSPKTENSDESAAMKRKLMKAVMEDLRPVRQIDLGLAVTLPKLGEKDSADVGEPDDRALAMLSERKPFNVFAVSRAPWQANRDSYPFHHKPLWYEDPNLERCGRGWGPLSTTVSAVHFAANTAILPYRFTAEKQWRCVRTLPDCTVCEKFGCEAYLPPWSWSGAAAQAAATVGIIYLVP